MVRTFAATRRWLIVFAWAIAMAAAFRSPGVGQEKESIQFERLGSGYGTRQYRRETWGLVGVDVTNWSDESARVLASFGFSPDSKLRYGRELWVPPRSVRRSWAPIRFPATTTTEMRQDLYGQLIDRSGGVEEVKSRESEYEQHESLVRIATDPFVTGWILGASDRADGPQEDFAYQAVLAARNNAGLGRRMAMIAETYLPPIPEGYDVLDQLVLQNDRFAEDPVACGAIRDWLNDGGVVWLMLDRVKLESAARLFGDRLRCEVVDRVELHEVDIQTIAERPQVQYAGSRTFEDPVPMVRVAVEDAEVTHEVAGWPASFSFSFGRGTVVATTVGGAAWVEERTGPRDVQREGEYQATGELDDLLIMKARDPAPAAEGGLDAYLDQQIGYEIVGRTPVMIVLGAFCLAMVAVGGWLLRQGRLERLAWFGPAIALAASAPLVYLGARSQQSAPPSVAVGQVVEVAAGSNFATVTGDMAMYRPQPQTVTIGANAGGTFEPDFQGLEQSIRRMVWTDMDRWRWERIRFTAGVRHAPFRQHLRLPEIVEARGTFNERGFQGALTGGLNMEDALIVAPALPSAAVSWDGDDFSSTPEDQLAEDQFLAGALLSDRQRRRQEVYSRIISNRSEGPQFPPRRALLGWSEPLDLQFDLGGDLPRMGGALIMAPLLLERPKAGTKMLIPASFVELRSASGPGEAEGSSPAFSARTGKWVGSKTPSRVWLYCHLPAELLPARLEQAEIHIKGTIPSRTVTLAGVQDGRELPVEKRTNLIGSWEIAIDDPELLQLDSAGRFRIGVLVGEELDPDPDSDGVQWKIEHVHVQLKATAE